MTVFVRDRVSSVIQLFLWPVADEVRAKSRALERSQFKLKSAQEEITDLQTEFELERQTYLDTIRNQVHTYTTWKYIAH